MFTGIIQAVASIAALRDQNGLRTFTLDFPQGFCQDQPSAPASPPTACA